MSTHLPTPWIEDGMFIRCRAYPKKGVIAQFPRVQAGGVFEAQENLSFALLAVNSFDALLSAAKGVLLQAVATSPDDGDRLCVLCNEWSDPDTSLPLNHADECAIASLESAIALAEGGRE